MGNADQRSKALSQQVRQTVHDLTLIRQSLAEISGRTNEQMAATGSALDSDLAAELQAVVDVLRELLWAYITALSVKSGRRPHEVLERYKTELAVAMLGTTPPHTSQERQEADNTFQALIKTALTVTAIHTKAEREP